MGGMRGVSPPSNPLSALAGDQIVSATVYFDNLQSGEVAQLLNSMGHHTVGLRLQRKGDRSPLPGQSWAHEAFGAGGAEVVLVSAVARGEAGRMWRWWRWWHWWRWWWWRWWWWWL